MAETVEIKIPDLGESVSEGTIANWLKSDGDVVEADEALLELETDKAVMEIPAETGGRLEVVVGEGETVSVGDVIAKVYPGESPPSTDAESDPHPTSDKGPEQEATESENGRPSADTEQPAPPESAAGEASSETLSPAVRKLVEEHDLDPAQIEGSGKAGRITKADVLNHLESRDGQAGTPTETPSEAPASERSTAPSVEAAAEVSEEDEVVREPMSQLRRRVAERLVEAQQQAAILTTFNDVDMTQVMELRKRYRDEFEQKYGVRLGFMSLFGRAVILALNEVPELNAFIDGTDVVYHKHVHLGVAVSTDRGLMVPVVKYADAMKLHELEAQINEMAAKARDKKITPDDLSGGTFSLSNGGIFGSMLSTPLLNPPQSGILGMHRIEERPVAVDGQVEIRPMMYVALSYDHRIVDGKEAVTFLRRVKEYLEDPRRIVIEV